MHGQSFDVSHFTLLRSCRAVNINPSAPCATSPTIPSAACNRLCPCHRSHVLALRLRGVYASYAGALAVSQVIRLCLPALYLAPWRLLAYGVDGSVHLVVSPPCLAYSLGSAVYPCIGG